MKATALQRYAMRLLFASKKCTMINLRNWHNLSKDEADLMMKPFGGQDLIIRDIVLPKKEESSKKSIEAEDSVSPAIAERTRNSSLEL